MFALASVIGIAARPQEASTQTREEILRDLETKFTAAGPLSAELSFLRIAQDRTTEVRARGSVYLDLGDRLAFTRIRRIEGGKESDDRFVLLEAMVTHSWGGGGPAVREDFGAPMESLHELFRDIHARLGELLGAAEPYPSFKEFLASSNPRLVFSIYPSLNSSTEAEFQFAMGLGSERLVSWFEEVRAEPGGEYRIRKDLVEFDLSGGKQTIALDRKTGVVRWIDIALKSGERRVLAVTDITSAPVRPKVTLPDRFSPPQGGVIQVARTIGSLARTKWENLGIRLLRQVPAQDLKENRDKWSRFFIDLAEKQAQWTWKFVLDSQADFMVAKFRDEGSNLSTVETDLRDAARVLGETWKENESNFKKSLTDFIRELRSSWLSGLSKSKVGSPECRTELSRVFEAALKPEDERRLIPPYPDPVDAIRRALKRANTAK